MNQRVDVEKRDVGDSAGVTSKLNDMQNAIESLTHSVNTVATKQQVRTHVLRFSFTKTAVCWSYVVGILAVYRTYDGCMIVCTHVWILPSPSQRGISGQLSALLCSLGNSHA